MKTFSGNNWIVALIGGLSLAGVSGCGRRAAPDMDLLGHQVAMEGVDAVVAGDPTLAEEKFARLRSIDPAWPGTEALLRAAVDRQALTAANAAADVRGALTALDAVRGAFGSSGELDDAAYRLMDLERVARYCQAPRERAAVAAAAFSDLPSPETLTVPAYVAWHGREAAAIEALARAERRRQAVALRATVDRGELAGEAEAAAAAMRRLVEIDPDYAAESAAAFAEFANFRAMRAGGAAVTALAREPETLCGEAVLALDAARAGRRGEALLRWRRLHESFSLADAAPLAAALAKTPGADALAAPPQAGSILSVIQILAK